MNGQDGHDQAVRAAQAAIVGAQVRQAMDAGTLTFSDYRPEEIERILASLPPAQELEMPS